MILEHLPINKLLTASSRRTNGPVPRRWLALAHAGWIVCTLLLLANFVASIPAYYKIMLTVCTIPNQPTCSMPVLAEVISWQLTPDNVQVLAHLHLSLVTYAAYIVTLTVLVSLLFWGVGLLIFWRKSGEGMGLLVSLLLVLYGATGTNNTLLGAYVPAHSSVLLHILLSLIEAVQWTGLGAFALTFPTGRFVPRWSWLVFALWIISNAGTRLSTLLTVAELLLLFGSTLFIMIYRYVRVFDAIQRQQTKWVIYTFVVAFSLNIMSSVLLGVVLLDSPYQLLNATISLLPTVLFPLGLGFAILRYRLWDIDVIINRTLVYGLLTACVVGLYVLVVVELGSLFQARGNLVISLFATGIIAVLFQPLRQRLQHAVNHLMYGERDDPYQVISRLGQRLEATVAPDSVLPTIVETVAQALKLPYAAIALKYGDEFFLAASHGVVKGEVIHLPLSYQSEQVGELLLAPRTPGESFTPADRKLLDDLVRQVGVAVHAMRLTQELRRLTQDLQHARERLVSAREEERRRLRQDLHDGLGPQLSSQTLLLTSAQMLLRQDPDEAEAILKSAVAQSQQAISDIRRLVYALRPPALDDLGLVAAIQEQLTQNRASGIAFSFDAPEQPPPLPAAVEVACYRIVQEAITNVVRHAHARKCTIHLTCEEQLIIEVIDDGQGLPPAYRCGVGLTSMRERAEELGGSWQIVPRLDGGTGVHAELPYR
jgi:signal transduction histidine kinase